MVQSNSFTYLVNYISGLDAYKFGIKDITLVLDKENISFINGMFNFSISIDKIVTVQFMRSPFKMPNPISPVNLNTACSYFRIYYFDGNFPKSVLFMMNNSKTTLFKNNEQACKDLFSKLSNNNCEYCRVVGPWGESKYDSELLKIKMIYTMSYLGGHPENHHKFCRVDFYVLKDSFYIDKYINENNFSAFDIPFSQIRVFELVKRKSLSILERIFSLGTFSNESDTIHIVFTNKKGTDISIYLSMLAGTSPQKCFVTLEKLLGRNS